MIYAVVAWLQDSRLVRKYEHSRFSSLETALIARHFDPRSAFPCHRVAPALSSNPPPPSLSSAIQIEAPESS